MILADHELLPVRGGKEMLRVREAHPRRTGTRDCAAHVIGMSVGEDHVRGILRTQVERCEPRLEWKPCLDDHVVAGEEPW